MENQFVVFVTVGDMETAEKIARALVEEHLAACVNIVPNMRSIYRWEGKVMDDRELILIIKTAADRFSLLKERVLKLHPYDVPEIIGVRIEEGHRKFLEWVDAETRPGT